MSAIAGRKKLWCELHLLPMEDHRTVVALRDVTVLDTLILPYVNGDCMQIFLNEVASRHPNDKIVMVLEGAGWHKAASLKLPENMKLLPLSLYAPELNPVEHLWDELREKVFGNLVFNSLDALENHLEASLLAMEHDQRGVRSIVAWPWIINSIVS